MPPAPPRAAARPKRWWAIVAAYAVVVLVLSVAPVPPKVSSIRHLDKVAHLGEYLVFAYLLVHAIRATWHAERAYRLWAWIDATSYGLLMELIQIIVPWRSAEWGDALANAVGAALGAWIGQWLPKSASCRIQEPPPS